jgi:hypothetical protein
MRGDETRRWPIFGLLRLTFNSVGNHFGQLMLALMPTLLLWAAGALLGQEVFTFLLLNSGPGAWVFLFAAPIIWFAIKTLALVWGLVI